MEGEGISAFRFLQQEGFIIPEGPEPFASNESANEKEVVLSTPDEQLEVEEEHKNGEDIIPQVQNVVSTADLGTKLDLKKIALQARNAEYNPKRFAAVIMRIREPKTTALIFATGKMVCAGAKSVDQSHKAARKFARIVQKMGFEVKFSHFKAQNLVGSCDVHFPIRLDRLATDQPLFARYEPELFPGLIYRLTEPKVVLLIFTSGKVVITGAKVEEDLIDAMQLMLPLLEKYQKKTKQ